MEGFEPKVGNFKLSLKEMAQKGHLVIGASKTVSDDSISSVTSNIVKIDYWFASG